MSEAGPRPFSTGDFVLFSGKRKKVHQVGRGKVQPRDPSVWYVKIANGRMLSWVRAERCKLLERPATVPAWEPMTFTNRRPK